MYKPPFRITATILRLCHSISNRIGFLEGLHLHEVPNEQAAIRLGDLVYSVLSTQNTLSREDIGLIADGTKLDELSSMPSRDVIEVQNSLKVYGALKSFNPFLDKSLLAAYRQLTQGLVARNSSWRDIVNPQVNARQEIVSAVTEAHQRVKDLHNFIRYDRDTPFLIKGCIYPYELRFANIFGPWNEQMGQLMMRLILMKESPIFEFMPFVISSPSREQEYKNALIVADNDDESTVLIEFYLQVILDSILMFCPSVMDISRNFKKRLRMANNNFGDRWFSKDEYIRLIRKVSDMKPLRDLEMGVDEGLTEMKINESQRIFRFVENANFSE